MFGCTLAWPTMQRSGWSVSEPCTSRGHIQGANRHEASCFPECLADDSAEDNPVRFREAFGEALDLEASGFQRAVPAATGRPGDAPGALLTLHLDGDLDRWRSSRRLEQATHRTVEWLWLLKKLRPDHQTIADVRKHHRKPRRQVCRPCTRLCKAPDRCGAELVALEGSTCRAANAKERHCTKDKRTKLIRQIDGRVKAYLTALARRDAREARGTGGGAHAKALAAKIEALKPRRLRDEGFPAQLPSSGQAQRSLTDPERRAMTRGRGRGTAVCSNVQTAADAKPKLSVACEVTSDPGARDGLSPVARQAQGVLGCRFDAGADGGDDHGPAVKACGAAGLTPDGPRPIPAAHEPLGLFSPDAFRYDSAAETDQGPAGQGLTCRVGTVALGRHRRYAATAAGTGGALKPPCTRSQDGRRSTRGGAEHLLEERAPRVRSRPAVMRRRKELAAPPLGTMQRWWDHGSFLMRGLEEVRTAFALTVRAYHLRRVLNRTAMPRLMAALG
jgi:transposase